MGGRNKGSGSVDNGRPGYAGQYSIETIDFWMSDPRVQSLSASARVVLFYLGLIAVKERREVLPAGWSWKRVGRRVEVSRTNLGRSTERIRIALEGDGLIDHTLDGRIIVCGARKRRPNLKWKDEAHIEGINGYVAHKEVSSKQEEVNARDAREPQKGKPKTKTPKMVMLDGRWVAQNEGD